jgi:hypothetical protein
MSQLPMGGDMKTLIRILGTGNLEDAQGSLCLKESLAQSP